MMGVFDAWNNLPTPHIRVAISVLSFEIVASEVAVAVVGFV
jgi:hypothetical protein